MEDSQKWVLKATELMPVFSCDSACTKVGRQQVDPQLLVHHLAQVYMLALPPSSCVFSFYEDRVLPMDSPQAMNLLPCVQQAHGCQVGVMARARVPLQGATFPFLTNHKGIPWKED